MAVHLVEPHGGALVDLLVDPARADELKGQSRNWASWDLTARQLCDLELLISGGLSPLRGFMTRRDYQGVCDTMRLADGTLWPIPITLDVTEQVAQDLTPGAKLALRDAEGNMLAVLTAEDIWQPDRGAEAEKVFGSTSPQHPGVAYLADSTNAWVVGGPVEGVQQPKHYDFVQSRLTPARVRDEFARRSWQKVVAFQPHGTMHREQYELTCRAAGQVGANLLIHPAVEATGPGDVDHYSRVRCYQAVLGHYPRNTAMLNLLPLALRHSGPRQTLWHAIVHKNHGASHLIVGPDHAGAGSGSAGTPFYGPYDGQELLRQHQAELGVTMVPVKSMLYLPDRDAYVPADEAPEGAPALSISDTQLRERLAAGADIPAWFSFPDVVAELRATYPPRSRQGFTVFFTGLSGSGKSTIANVLAARLLEMGGRTVTLWDGDLVRKNLSSELGFSRAHRDVNVRRIGFVAAQDTRNGGIAICAPIAPYAASRQANRELISAHGGYVLVHVATPLAVCEQRDTKGLYAKARAGIITEFTGISDPYEEPDDADIVLDTVDATPEECAQQVILHLEKEGYIRTDDA